MEEEEKKKKRDKVKKKPEMKQQGIDKYFQKGKSQPLVTETSQSQKDGTGDESSEDEMEALKRLSKVYKVKAVEDVKLSEIGISNVQAIYINPKWKSFDPETQTDHSIIDDDDGTTEE